MLIKNWEELSKLPNESKTHVLDVNVETGSAWLYTKNPKPYNKKLSFMRQILNQDVYLSTHSFYDLCYKQSTKILKVCGFDVELDNWDKEVQYVFYNDQARKPLIFRLGDEWLIHNPT